MEFSNTCRTCLNSKKLKPIFEKPDVYKRYSNALLKVAGIKMELNDGLPQQMCTYCIGKLNRSLKFRKQALNVEKQLVKLKNQMNDEPLIKTENVYEPDDFTIDDEELIKEESVDTNENGDIDKPDDCTNDDEELFKEESVDTNENKDNKNKYNCSIDIMLCKRELKAELEESFGINLSGNDREEPLRYIDNESLSLNVDVKEERKSIDQDAVVVKSDDIENCLNTVEREEEQKERHRNTEGRRGKRKRKKDVDADPNYALNDGTVKKQRVTCKVCHKNLSIRSIDAHMTKMHPGADERRVKCDCCDAYVLGEKMNRHVVMVHTAGDRFRCGYCKTEFDSRDLLIDHVKACRAKKKRRQANGSAREMQECDVCHKRMQRASLRMHKRIKHAGLGPICEHCGLKFGNKFRLNDHYRAKHGYEKFKCSYCDFQSAGTMSMRNHERRHRGEKPFACDCGAAFHAPYLLAQHKQSHRTEKLVKCDRCPARYKARNSLHAHRRVCARAGLRTTRQRKIDAADA